MRSLVIASLLTAAVALTACTAQAVPSTLEVVMSEFKFEPTPITLPADTEVELTVINAGVVEHDLMIGALGVHVRLDPNRRTSLTLGPLPAGTYEAYCTVPGHREAGMVTTVTVR